MHQPQPKGARDGDHHAHSLSNLLHTPPQWNKTGQRRDWDGEIQNNKRAKQRKEEEMRQRQEEKKEILDSSYYPPEPMYVSNHEEQPPTLVNNLVLGSEDT